MEIEGKNLLNEMKTNLQLVISSFVLSEGKTNYAKNPDYEPVAIRDLIDPSMSFWVHHTDYILPQGRTTWWNPSGKGEVMLKNFNFLY